ncbi:MAG: hypothetical protein U0232_12375 [Thermomicrobiales bacterium]
METSHPITITLDEKFYRPYADLAVVLGLAPTEVMQHTLEGGSYVMWRLIRHFQNHPDLIEAEGRLEGFVGKAVFVDLSDCLDKLVWEPIQDV